MEEIVTVDGRQFKLTVDRPMTATEKAQVLAEIRKQTGCGTCGTRVVQTGNDWQYGGVRSLVPTYSGTPGTPPGVNKGSGDDVTLTVHPIGGVGPYTVRYYIHHNSGDRGTLISTARLGTGSSGTNPPGKTLVGGGASNPVLSVPENTDAVRVYILDDTDISTATNDVAATEPTDVNATTGALTFGATPAAKGAALIRFYTSIVDSCTGTTGPAACVQWADVALVCIPPTCNFVVS